MFCMITLFCEGEWTSGWCTSCALRMEIWQQSWDKNLTLRKSWTVFPFFSRFFPIFFNFFSVQLLKVNRSIYFWGQSLLLWRGLVDFALIAMEELPDESLLKIMEYLSFSDILRTMAPVSRKFYRLSRDKNIIKQVKFKSIVNTVKWQSFWSEERKNKYFNDFFDVLKNALKLKCLALCLDNLSAKKFFQNWIQTSVNHQCLEEVGVHYGDVQFGDLSNWTYGWWTIWNFLGQCPKLKILKIEGYLNTQNNLLTILKTIASFNSNCLQELHLNFCNNYAQPSLGKSLKNVLKTMTQNFPNMKYLCLTLNFEICQTFLRICEEIASEQIINIEIKNTRVGIICSVRAELGSTGVP